MLSSLFGRKSDSSRAPAPASERSVEVRRASDAGIGHTSPLQTKTDVDSTQHITTATTTVTVPTMPSKTATSSPRSANAGLTAAEIRDSGVSSSLSQEKAASAIMSSQLDANSTLPVIAHSEPMYGKADDHHTSKAGIMSLSAGAVEQQRGPLGGKVLDDDYEEPLRFHLDESSNGSLALGGQQRSNAPAGSNAPMLSLKQQQLLGMYSSPAETTRAYTKNRISVDLARLPSRSMSQPNSPRMRTVTEKSSLQQAEAQKLGASRARSSSVPTVSELMHSSTGHNGTPEHAHHSRVVSMTDSDWKPLLSHESFERPQL